MKSAIQHPTRILWTGLIIVIMSSSAYWMRPLATRTEMNRGMAIFIFGILLLGSSLVLSRQLMDETHEDKHPTLHSNPIPIHVGITFLGVICLAILTQINLLNPLDDRENALAFLRHTSTHVQVALFLFGCGFLAWGLSGGVRLKWRRPQITLDRLLLLILAIALGLRLWNLENWIHRFLDELHFASAVVRIEADPNQKLLQPFSSVTAFSWLFPYIQTWTTQLLQPSMTALRIVAVGFGVAQVWAIYLLGKWVIDRKVGLIAASFLATFPIQLHFSRIGIANVADPFWGILAMALLVRGLKTQHQRDFVLAGGCLGLTQYFYEGGRLFYTPFVICWLIWLRLFLKSNSRFTFPSLRNLSMMSFTVFMIAFPLYYTWVVNQIAIVPRLEETARDNSFLLAFLTTANDFPLQVILNPILESFMGYVHLTPTGWFYGGESAFILIGMVPFFLLGIAHAVYRLRRVDGALLFWWLMAGVVAVSLVQDPVTAPRHMPIYPAAMLLVAIGIRFTVPMLMGKQALDTRRLNILMGALTIVLSAYQASHYFYVHIPNFYQEQVYPLTDHFNIITEDTEDTLFRVLNLPPNSDVHIVHHVQVWAFNIQVVKDYWRLTEMTIQHVNPPDFILEDDRFFVRILTPEYLESLNPQRPQAFFLRADDTESLALIEQYFTLSEPIWSPYDIPREKQMVLFMAEAD